VRRGEEPKLGLPIAPYLTEIVGVFAAEARTLLLRRFDCDFQCAGSGWDGVEFDGVSAGGSARGRMVAAADTSVCSPHLVPFVVGWGRLSKSLLESRGAEHFCEDELCGCGCRGKFGGVVGGIAGSVGKWIVRLVGSGAWVDGDFGD